MLWCYTAQTPPILKVEGLSQGRDTVAGTLWESAILLCIEVVSGQSSKK